MSWGRFCLCSFAGLVLVGCKAPGPNLRTPTPEQFVIPAENDPRYSQAPEYPKDLLNKPPVKPATQTGIQGVKGMNGGGPGGNMMPGAPF